MNRDLDYVLNYMVKYTKDRFMQDSEPMLNYRDIEIVLKHILDLELENKQLKVKSEVLEENNKLLIQQKTQMYEDLDIAYEKIDKAIEYIKENSHKVEWGDIEQDNESIDINDDVTETEFVEQLLEILGDLTIDDVEDDLLEILGDKENEHI